MSSNPPQPAATPADMNPAACADKLKELFPALFAGAPKPLKLKIQADIQERAPGVFTRQVLSAFFRRHTGATSYLIALTKSPHRFDLDGQPAGEISDEHRQAATEELARRRANQQARREQEDQERRNRAQLLRDYERTTLTRANFCALKGVAEAELDGLLEIARKEAAEAPPRQDPRGRPHPDRQRPGRPGGGGGRDGGRREGGGREGARRPDGRAPAARPPRPRDEEAKS